MSAILILCVVLMKRAQQINEEKYST